VEAGVLNGVTGSVEARSVSRDDKPGMRLLTCRVGMIDSAAEGCEAAEEEAQQEESQKGPEAWRQESAIAELMRSGGHPLITFLIGPKSCVVGPRMSSEHR
jgi:hypothetical protein